MIAGEVYKLMAGKPANVQHLPRVPVPFEDVALALGLRTRSCELKWRWGCWDLNPGFLGRKSALERPRLEA